FEKAGDGKPGGAQVQRLGRAQPVQDAEGEPVFVAGTEAGDQDGTGGGAWHGHGNSSFVLLVIIHQPAGSVQIPLRTGQISPRQKKALPPAEPRRQAPPQVPQVPKDRFGRSRINRHCSICLPRKPAAVSAIFTSSWFIRTWLSLFIMITAPIGSPPEMIGAMT